MMVDTMSMVAMTEANQNFSKVAKMVDEQGMAIILKNNKPRYVLVDFQEYDEIKAMRAAIIEKHASEILAHNMEAFKELAK